MTLRPLPLPPDPAPLPAWVAAVLADGRERLAEHFARSDLQPGHGAIPSDHELVVHCLCTLRAQQPDLVRFLEWGSGLGIVTVAEGAEVDIEPCMVDAEGERGVDHLDLQVLLARGGRVLGLQP